jgi:hypothetical protein
MSNGSFEAPRAIPGSASSTASAHFPEVRVDDIERVFVLWKQYPRGETRSRGLLFTHSADGGDHFAAPSPVPGIAGDSLGYDGSQQGSLTTKLAVGGDGTLAVVNSTFVPGQVSHVRLVRGRLAR